MLDRLRQKTAPDDRRFWEMTRFTHPRTGRPCGKLEMENHGIWSHHQLFWSRLIVTVLLFFCFFCILSLQGYTHIPTHVKMSGKSNSDVTLLLPRIRGRDKCIPFSDLLWRLSTALFLLSTKQRFSAQTWHGKIIQECMNAAPSSPPPVLATQHALWVIETPFDASGKIKLAYKKTHTHIETWFSRILDSY